MSTRDPRAPSQRLRRGISAVATPAGPWLALRMLAWSAALPVLKSLLPLQTLVRLMGTEQRPSARDSAAEDRIVAMARIVHRGLGLGRRDNCLERSLLAFHYLAVAQAKPALVVAARGGDSGIEGHVWTLLDGVAVHDNTSELQGFVPVTVFRADGSRDDVPCPPSR